jgi:Ohr subfamily peroxiredoxin
VLVKGEATSELITGGAGWWRRFGCRPPRDSLGAASPGGPPEGRPTKEAAPLLIGTPDVTGGRADGHGRTTDGELEVDLRLPRELGGEGGGTNPEELFAVGYAACFESSLQAAGRRDRLEPGDVEIDSRVILYPTTDRGFQLGVELAVALPAIESDEKAVELVEAADEICPYSNATRGNIEVRLIANGRRGKPVVTRQSD